MPRDRPATSDTPSTSTCEPVLVRIEPPDAAANGDQSALAPPMAAEASVVRTLKSLQTGKRPPLETGLVVTDVHEGEVIAVVGSRQPTVHGFNRAVEARRPVGSLLKPFVYLRALSAPSRYSLATWVDDSPVSVVQPNGRRWTPGNSDGRSHGTVRLIVVATPGLQAAEMFRHFDRATKAAGVPLAPPQIVAIAGEYGVRFG